MSKRRPDVQLTKDNYDQESGEEVEPSSEPQIASEEVLKNRPMMKAKRRLADDGASSALFSGFKTFSGASNSFGGFNTGTFTSSSTSNFGTSFAIPSFTENKSPPITTIVQGNSDNNGGSDNNNGHMESESDQEKAMKADSTKDIRFTANLTKLNNTFYDHIKKYMDSELLYDFTVVCSEYVHQCKRLKENKSEPSIEMPKPDSSQGDTDGLFKFGEKTSELANATFKLPQSTFSFGQTSVAFGGSPQKKPQFNFGTSNPNLFGNNIATSTPLSSKFAAPTIASTTTEENSSEAGPDEEDAPPKVVSVQHSESDAVYTIKCKLFYQKEDKFVQKGLGYLYIISKGDSKPQLLIRSDTPTGNILLNIALVSSLPVKTAPGKDGKINGVMLTCIPNPEIEPQKKDGQENGNASKQTVTFLIRVKPTDGEELYNTIVQYKSQD